MARTGVFTSQAAHSRYLEEFYEPALSRWSVPHESIYVQTSFGMVHLLRCGKPDGEPVILTNGVGEDVTYWGRTDLLPRLCERYEVLVPDRIGDPGKSDYVLQVGVGRGEDMAWFKPTVVDAGHPPAEKNWQTLEYDVTKYAGQTVRIELKAFAGGPKHPWHNDRAYFDEIRVVAQ